MSKEEILKRVKKEILKISPVERIVLYGSRARGDYHNSSDKDLLILVKNKLNNIHKDKIIDSLFYLELESDQIFSPIIHDVAELEKLKITSFYQNVQQEGILL